jgi:hypothetical protein
LAKAVGADAVVSDPGKLLEVVHDMTEGPGCRFGGRKRRCDGPL